MPAFFYLLTSFGVRQESYLLHKILNASLKTITYIERFEYINIIEIVEDKIWENLDLN